ncbi:hypothetical protein ACQ4PT_042152 [Festuca glaucescens]
MGVLTQADRGHGPPDRFAVAELQGNTMLRFLSDTAGDWEVTLTAPCKLPLARRVFFERGNHDQEAFAFGGQLWWVDLTWGAILADAFSEQPEPRFVELPRGSVLPARSTVPTGRVLRTIEEGDALRRCALGRYRRMGVSEGRLRYVEVWDREPFMLSLFSLNDEGSAWKLEHRVVLSRLWVDGDHPWLPLPEKTTPQIVALDPLNGDLIYLMVGTHIVVLDMNREEVIGSSPRNGTGSCVTCVLPPWLESSRSSWIPAAGNH